ncbi:hypothetical protein [Nocardiopsis sp. NPDC006938]|uniref:hypothetical protein n=1 Tax=Nocardiopsis sp. NPDC006938 TaxID=3364337 RepID=UPI003686BAAD
MAHHVPDADVPRRSPLPANPFARFALVSLVGAAGAVVLLGVAAFGGLERADAVAEPAGAGTEVENALIRISPHQVRVVSDELGDTVQLRADIEMHGSERPVFVADAARSVVLTLEPSGERAESPSVFFQRRPDGLVSHFQPHMPEADAVLSWDLPDGVDADGIEGAVVTVHEVEKLHSRGGGGVLWATDDKAAVGAVGVPLEGTSP